MPETAQLHLPWPPPGQRATASRDIQSLAEAVDSALAAEWQAGSSAVQNSAGSASLGANPVLVCRYRRYGSTIRAWVLFHWGTGASTGSPADVILTLPVSAREPQPLLGQVKFTASSFTANGYLGYAQIVTGGQKAILRAYNGSNYNFKPFGTVDGGFLADLRYEAAGY